MVGIPSVAVIVMVAVMVGVDVLLRDVSEVAGMGVTLGGVVGGGEGVWSAMGVRVGSFGTKIFIPVRKKVEPCRQLAFCSSSIVVP